MYFKHTKIVATIGPASCDKETLRAMILAGMNVARLNFSHGEYEWYRKLIQTLRELQEELDTPLALLADLQGPRVRTRVKEEFSFEKGEHLTLSFAPHRGKVFSFDHPDIIQNMQVGDRVLVEDGLYEFVAREREGGNMRLEATTDGTLRDRKGVILPDTKLELSVLSDKDREDLAFVLQEGVDYVGLSFVGSAEDVAEVRSFIEKHCQDPDDRPEIVAKIERKVAIENLSSIIQASDGVMVARGDLGIEMPESEVVLWQKRIIKESLASAKPVIVATQMMKSMTENTRPTRAEVSDVSNAVIDHADAVMLSEETAMGKYPVDVVAFMREIIEKVEVSPFDDLYQALDLNFSSDEAVIARSVYELAKSFSAEAVVFTSLEGSVARLISHFRPEKKLLAATHSKRAYQRMALYWGVRSFLFAEHHAHEGLPEQVMARAKEQNILQSGNKAVVLLCDKLDERDLSLVGIREVK